MYISDKDLIIHKKKSSKHTHMTQHLSAQDSSQVTIQPIHTNYTETEILKHNNNWLVSHVVVNCKGENCKAKCSNCTSLDTSWKWKKWSITVSFSLLLTVHFSCSRSPCQELYRTYKKLIEGVSPKKSWTKRFSHLESVRNPEIITYKDVRQKDINNNQPITFSTLLKQIIRSLDLPLITGKGSSKFRKGIKGKGI